MKKYILVLAAIALLTDIYVCMVMHNQIADNAKSYFEKLIEQQRLVAQKQVDSIFTHKHIDVFPIYSRCKPHYIKGSIKKSNSSMFENFMDIAYKKPKLPADVKSTYHVVLEDGYRGSIEDVKSEIRSYNLYNEGAQTGMQQVNMKGLWQTGWGLGVRENWDGGLEGRRIVEYVVTPYAVSYRDENNYVKSYYPIEDILDAAYRFYTNDDKSDYKRNLVSNVGPFINKPYIDNSFFSLEEDTKGNPFLSGISMYADYGTYMYTDLYYVFIKAYGRKCYELVQNKDFINNKKEQYIVKKKNMIVMWGLLSISLLTIICLICSYLIYKDLKESKQTLLKRILSKCNPKEYIKNYDGHLLDIANNIYRQALATDINDDEGIMKLASLAESGLGVVLISKSDIRSLKKICNPKRFMKPYNQEKVAIANELYTKLNQERLSCAEYFDIKKKLILLYEGEETKKTRISFPQMQIKGGDKLLIIILIITSIIYYAKRCVRDDKLDNVELNNSTVNTFKKTADGYESNVQTADESKYSINSLNTGDTPYIKPYGTNYNCSHNQCSGIKVTAPKESDIVVVIKRNNKEGKVISHGYIKARETYQFDIPSGTYQIFFYFGNGWDPDKKMGNGVRGGFVKDEVFSKDKPQKINNSVLSYVLQFQKNGNFSTQSSNRSEMF